MTRTRSTVGRISFVGAGPGDPSLLTRRALWALAEADHVVYDSDCAVALLEVVRAQARPEAQFSPAEGNPGDVAKVLLSAARSGLRAVRLAGGDPFAAAPVVAEVRSVARTAVPFEVVPGVCQAAAAATYAGVPLSAVRVTADIASPRDASARDASPRDGGDNDGDTEAVSATAPAGVSPAVGVLAHAARLGPVALRLDVRDVAGVRDALLDAGLDPTTPAAVTVNATSQTQMTTSATLDGLVSACSGVPGRVTLLLGAAVAQREDLSWWENRSLYGWKVLVPRTKEQAGAMSARLRSYGAIPSEVPTIAVEPPRTPAQMERAIKGLVDGRYAWTIFTSVNAVRAVWEKFAEHGLDARHFGGVKIACVGQATADAVRAFGIQPELVPGEEQSTDGLLAEFPPYDEVLDPVGRILLPRADIATETLTAGLVEMGWEVDDVTAYRTVRAAPPPAEVRDAIKSGGFDAVLFTSSSTVRNLVGIAGKPHARTVVAVIGPKTAETAAEFGLRVDVQPGNASVPDLVEALATYAAELREKLAALPAKQRRGAKVQGPTALRAR